MKLTTHPDFGQELHRPFEVHENCFDCAGFYYGCKGWRASTDFACGDFHRLPDVLPGTCGQRFPAVSRKLACGMAKGRQTEYADTIPCSSAPDTDSRVAADDSGEAPVVNRVGVRACMVNRERLCGCGATLSKGKRFCDQCRTENRRKAKRGYMRTYMEQRRFEAVHADSRMPSTHTGTLSVQAGSHDPPSIGLRPGGPGFQQTSVLTEHL